MLVVAMLYYDGDKNTRNYYIDGSTDNESNNGNTN